MIQSFVIFIPLGVGDRTQFQTPARSQIFTLWATFFVLAGPHFVDSFSPDVYVSTSLTGRSRHAVDTVDADTIGTLSVDGDVGEAAHNNKFAPGGVDVWLARFAFF